MENANANSSLLRAPSLLWDQWRGARRVGPALLFVGLGVILVLPAQFLRLFTEALLTPQSTSVLPLAATGGVIAFVLFIAELAGTLTRSHLRFQIESSLRGKVLNQLHRTQIPDGQQRQALAGRLEQDLLGTETFLTQTIPGQLKQVGMVGAVLVVLGIYGGAFALAPLLAALVLIAALVWGTPQTQFREQGLEELHASGPRMLRETLSGMRTIRSHGVEPFLQRRFEGHLGDLALMGLSIAKSMGLLRGLGRALGQVLVTACLGLTLWGVTTNRLPAVSALVFPFFLVLLFQGVRELARLPRQWRTYQGHEQRLRELIEGEGPFSHRFNPLPSPPALDEAHQIALKDLEIGSPSRAVAGPVSLKVHRGETWAVMGPGGCGKSIFLETLAGVRPALGGHAEFRTSADRVLWKGSDATQLPPSGAAYVSKNPYLFEGTFRDNLTFGNPGRMSDTVIWQFLERAGLYHFVRMRGGLDKPVFSSNHKLKRGERLRLGLCRALLLKRPFLLLDEPFVGVDDTSLELVMGTLEFQKHLSGIVIVTQFVPQDFHVDGIISFERNDQFNHGVSEAHVSI